MSKTLVFPTVHRNGTNGNDLLEQITEARHALRIAIKAVENAAPNGRDYYVQGDDVIYKALEQHIDRLAACEWVLNELGQIGEAIADQE